jgi:NAD(P)-dependent dehydrogenase (short-subunit alcohol dehydrogenase family)
VPSVVVVGASRGIGRELARQYAADGGAVCATVRTAGPTPDATGVFLDDRGNALP